MSDLIQRLRDGTVSGAMDLSRLMLKAADEIERLRTELSKALALSHERTAEVLEQAQRIAELEGVRDAAKYLSAEVDNDWREGRPSIDSRQAMHTLDEALAATEQEDKT